jgi:hypothetical protein
VHYTFLSSFELAANILDVLYIQHVPKKINFPHSIRNFPSLSPFLNFTFPSPPSTPTLQIHRNSHSTILPKKWNYRIVFLFIDFVQVWDEDTGGGTNGQAGKGIGGEVLTCTQTEVTDKDRRN